MSQGTLPEPKHTRLGHDSVAPMFLSYFFEPFSLSNDFFKFILEDIYGSFYLYPLLIS